MQLAVHTLYRLRNGDLFNCQRRGYTGNVFVGATMGLLRVYPPHGSYRWDRAEHPLDIVEEM